MVLTLQPTTLATTTNIRVLSTLSVVSVTPVSHVARFRVTPAKCMAATTSQIQDGKLTV